MTTQGPTDTTNGQPTAEMSPEAQSKMRTAMTVASAANDMKRAGDKLNDEAFRLALEPGGFHEASALAAMAAKIRLCGVETAEDALVRIMTGRALGLPTFAAMRSVYVIEGRPALEAKLKVALATRHPDCEYFRLVETSATKATYVAKKRSDPKPLEFSFTIDQARAAGLLDRGNDERSKKMNNWNRYPDAMLRARASSQLVDILFPDATLGLPSREEIEDESPRASVDELTGEVVHPPAQPPQAAPLRNFVAESQAIVTEIAAAKAPLERKALRGKVGQFIKDADPASAEIVRQAYNEALARDSQAGSTQEPQS